MSADKTLSDDKRKNPKCAIREARKEQQTAGIGTKAQQALQLQHEQNKLERQIQSKEKKGKNSKDVSNSDSSGIELHSRQPKNTAWA